MLKSGKVNRGEAWVCCEQDGQLDYEGITIRLVSDFKTAKLDPVDVLFVRGDKKAYLPTIEQGYRVAKRLLFYAASGRGIPRHGKQFHGILVDDIRHQEIIQRYHPGVYVGEFLKTAYPETFRTLPGTKKDFDLCMIGTMGDYRKNLQPLAGIADHLSECTFVLCGNISPQTAQTLGGKEGQVVMAGYLTHEELNVIINRSKLALIPSNESDASPRIILEYMAAGLPILANEKMCGGKKYILEGAGELAPIETFTQRIPKMLSNLNQYNANHVFTENFAPEKMGTLFADHCHAVLKMDDKIPSLSLRGRIARLMRIRVDQEYQKENS